MKLFVSDKLYYHKSELMTADRINIDITFSINRVLFGGFRKPVGQELSRKKDKIS